MTVAGPMPVLSASVIFFFPRDGQLIFFEGQVLLRDVRDDLIILERRSRQSGEVRATSPA